MYLLQYPQSPLLKTEAYDKYEIDDYPLGTNACVAVISYTGYDMEGKHFVMIVYKTWTILININNKWKLCILLSLNKY